MRATSKSIIQSVNAVNIFCSYSCKDEDLKVQLIHFLREKSLSFAHNWHEHKIDSNPLCNGQIHEDLDAANIRLLLLSQNFMLSDHSWETEIQNILERQDTGKILVFPILLSPVGDLQKTPFRGLEILPTQGKAVIEWRNRKQAFAKIEREIAKRLKSINISSPSKKKVEWELTIEEEFDTISDLQVANISRILRRLANDIMVTLINKNKFRC